MNSVSPRKAYTGRRRTRLYTCIRVVLRRRGYTQLIHHPVSGVTQIYRYNADGSLREVVYQTPGELPRVFPSSAV